MRRKTKRHLKKYLRQREKELNKHLSRFLNDFDLTRSFNDEANFKPLLKIRWQIYELIYIRLKLHPRWIGKQWFLDLLDVDDLEVGNNRAWFTGDIVWWAEGKDAVGEWYPADHEPQKTRPYKEKIRGDLDGGYWILEPWSAKLVKSKIPKQNAGYEIEFGKGSTYMKIKSR